MKLLIVSPEKKLIHHLFTEEKCVASELFVMDINNPVYYRVENNLHEIYWLNCGYGCFELSAKLSALLSKEKYHLIIYAGQCFSIKEIILPNTVVNIINDHPGDFGTMKGNNFMDFYEMGFWDRNSFPHIRGALVNKTTAYFNAFLPFTKVAACTLNTMDVSNENVLRYRSKYPFDVISNDGAAFQYTCMLHRALFYQLRYVIDKESENADISFATIFLDLIKKL